MISNFEETLKNMEKEAAEKAAKKAAEEASIKEKRDIAKRLLNLNIAPSEISKATGLPVEEIQKLQKE